MKIKNRNLRTILGSIFVLNLLLFKKEFSQLRFDNLNT